MLADHQRRLLTAAVDGELTPRQARLLAKLLDESPEAARMYRRLAHDAGRLRRMRHRTPDLDLSAQVMAAIVAENLSPLRRRPRVQSWVRSALVANGAAAAAVFLAVGLVSYLYFQSAQLNRPPAVAENSARQHPKPADDTAKATRPPERLPAPREQDAEPPVVIVDGGRGATHGTPAVPPHQPEGPRDVIAAPPGTPIELQEVQLPRMPFLTDAAELQKPEVRAALLEEWRRDEFSRVDVFCTDTTRAAELVQAALAPMTGKALTEASLADRLKKRQPTRMAFFCDGLTPEEVAKLLESATAPRKGEEPPFERFVASPLSAGDRKDLAALLGVDLLRSRPAPPKAGTLTGDPRKPVSEDTGAQIAGLLNGTGGTGTPPKPADRPVLALPYPATRVVAAGVPEVRKYLETRGERKPGTVGLVLVVRPTRG